MFYETYGTGNQVIVGLHGWGGNHRAFAPLIPHLPLHARLVVCDMPGYGRTPAPTTYTITCITRQIADWIDSLDYEDVTLFGNCLGALMALLVAPRLRKNISRLILLDAFAYLPWYFRVFSNRTFGDYAYYTTFANPVGRWLTNISLTGRREAGTDMTASFEEVNHSAMLDYLRMMTYHIPDYHFFSDVKASVELVHGANTFDAVKKSVPLWKSLWPNAQVLVLNKAGHLGIQEAPLELAEFVFRSNEARHAIQSQ